MGKHGYPFKDIRMKSIDINLFFSYSASFIERQFRKFASEYLSDSLFSLLISDERQYSILYQKIMNQPIIRPSQTVRLNEDDDTDNTTMGYNAVAQQITTKSSKPSTKSTDTAKKLILHYHHEKRFHSFKHDLHKLYDDTYQNTPGIDLKLLIGNRNRRNAAHQLIRKRPKQILLRDKPIKRKSA